MKAEQLLVIVGLTQYHLAVIFNGDRKRCRHDHSGGGSRCDYISTNQHESARQDLNKFELCVLLHRQLERDFRAWLDCREPMIGSGLENNNDAQ